MNIAQDALNRREQEPMFSFKDILHIALTKWYWIALSVLICIAAAVLYLKSAPKEYTRTASVLIKDNSKGGGISESAVFEDLQMFNVKRNVDNEILVFRSNQLMLNVVRRLNLDINYKKQNGLRKVELYTHSPITVSLPEAEDTHAFTFNVTPINKNEVNLSNFSANTNESIIVALNDTVETSIGKIIVTPSLYYSSDYYNVTVTVEKQNLEEVALYYSKALQVSLASKLSTIINITLKDESIPRTEDIINTLIAVYNEEAINDKNKIMINTSNFINERLIIIEKELGNVDSNIESYKRENRLTDIHSETGIYLRESSQYNQEELALENQKTLITYIRSYLTDPRKTSELIPANTGISDVNIEKQISEYNEMLLRRDKLISNSSDRNPVVMNLNNSLNATKQSIIRAVDNLIVGLNIQLRNIRQRELQTSRRISEVPTQQKHVLSIERQQKIKEELYLYLLNKREENAISQAITESNARIIDPATGSNMPVAPKSKIILLGAFLLGLLIPAGVLWLKLSFNTSVQTRKDIEDGVTIPFLGDIPLRDKKNKNEIVVKENSNDPISEAFRIIRTNMDFMRVKSSNLKVVMFTSYNQGAGKTFISTNLAMSIALTRKKVVLVDLDIRKRTLSSRVGNKKKGVTNYLSGNISDIHDIISKGELMDTLDIIHAGPIPPNPAELLLSERLELMVNELNKEYDYIILDNVPSGIVADATIVNRVTNLTIYVIRAGLLDKRQLPELERLYQQKKFNNMCLILNGVNYKQAAYYGQHHGYRYSYTDKS